MKTIYSFLILICILPSMSFAQNTYYGTGAGTGGVNSSNFGASAGRVITGTTTTGNSNFGNSAGYNTTTGSSNSFFGSSSGYRNSTGSSNVFLGSAAGANFTTGNQNTFIGYYTGSGVFPSTGNYNTAFGDWASQNLTSGSYNLTLGHNAGYNNSTGSGNIFLGSDAGYNETGSNKLYISNSSTSTPLIYGDFSSNSLMFNSSLTNFNGSVRGNVSGALRVDSGYGYLEIGAQNAGWAHFQTDRPRFYFNAPITVDGGQVGSYDEDLNLQTSGMTRVTILNSSGNLGIGATPQARLHVAGSVILDNGNNPLLYTGLGGSELNRYLLLINSPDYTSASGLKAGVFWCQTLIHMQLLAKMI